MSKIPESYLPPKELWPDYVVPDEFADTPMKLNLADYLLDRHIREGRGDNIAIKFMDKTFTYAQLQTMVNKFGNALRDAGVDVQDRVGIRLVNSPQAVITIFAIEKIGAIPVPTSPLWSAEEIAFVANNAEMKYFVVNAPLMAPVETAKANFEFGTRVVVIGGVPEEVKAAGNLVFEEMLEKGAPALDAVMLDAEDIGIILYTSGTTGMPKGCVHFVRPSIIEAKLVNKYVYKMKPGDVLGGAAPVSFAAGFGTFTLLPFEGGAAISLIPKFSPPDMMELIPKHKINLMTGLPTGYRALMKFPAFKDFDISSVRLYTSGGGRSGGGNPGRVAKAYGKTHLGGAGRNGDAPPGHVQYHESRTGSQFHWQGAARCPGPGHRRRRQRLQAWRSRQYDSQRAVGDPLLETLCGWRAAPQVSEKRGGQRLESDGGCRLHE